MPVNQQSFPFLKGGGEMASLIGAHDWSCTSLGSIEEWPLSLRNMLGVMLTSRFPMLIFWGRELITFYNDAFRPSLGNNGKHPSSLGQRGEQSWAESWPVIGPMIYNIMAGGDAVWFEDQKLPLYRDGKMDYAYWTYSFSPVGDESGEVAGVLVTCMETTKTVEGIQRLEESELFVRSVIDNSPIAKVVFTGSEMVISTINQNMLAMLGRDSSIVGQPFMVAMPELVPTPLMDRLRRVYTTGETFVQPEEEIVLLKDGQPYTGYYNYVYKALRNVAGDIYGIIVTATEITNQVKDKKRLEEAEAELSSAVELAELATWTIDLASKKITYSKRLQHWLGLSAGTFAEGNSPYIDEKDRERVRTAIVNAIAFGSEGRMDETYTIVNQQTGRQRIIHAVGRAQFGSDGKALSLSGTAQDVTGQVNVQMALEHEVRVRTRQLEAANRELAQTNKQLTLSNEELAQYAYVASHDLQEPLRKIRFFSSQLQGAELPLPTLSTIDKIHKSTERMSRLIGDLLEFSQLLKSEQLLRQVSLQEIVAGVKEDHELLIAEKGAIVKIGSLPVIEAVSIQMNRLFGNLLGNALKFTKPERQPVIEISSWNATADELRTYLEKPLPETPYWHVEVKDNGIGFDPELAEHIFDVFQRLHGGEQYAGTGIGLAICRRVVENHQGQIFVDAAPGAGASFHLLLPQKQVVVREPSWPEHFAGVNEPVSSTSGMLDQP